MANYLDYLRFRGDLSIKQDPLNPIDSAILSALVYLPLDDIMKYRQSVPIGEVARLLLDNPLYRVDDLPEIEKTLLELLRRSPRFSSARITNWETKFNYNPAIQFAAMTVLFENKTAYIVFRGTDTTMVGWNEDMVMSYAPTINGQFLATLYLKQMSAKYPKRKLFVAGHSKGGNLAIFAATHLSMKIQERISYVYNLDGPGFEKNLLQNKRYKNIQHKILTFIPQGSIFGRMLDHNEPHIIVKSSTRNLLAQHVPDTWDIGRTNFIEMPEVTNGSIFIDKTLRRWVEEVPRSRRKLLWKAIFEAFEKADITDLSQLTDGKIQSAISFTKAFRGLDPKTKKLAIKVAVHLFHNARQNLDIIFPFL